MAMPHQHAGFSAPGVCTEEAQRTNAIFAQRHKCLEDFMRSDGISGLEFKVLQKTTLATNGQLLGFHIWSISAYQINAAPAVLPP